MATAPPDNAPSLFSMAFKTKRAPSRVFSFRSDDRGDDYDAWKQAIEATKKGDAASMALALERRRGSVEPIGSTGKPRGNVLAKAIMALQEDPAAWARLRNATDPRGRHITPGDDSESDWVPDLVDLASYMWAANPTALAEASKHWRTRANERGIWDPCPFLRHAWESKPEPASFIENEAIRLFELAPYSYALTFPIDDDTEPPPLIPSACTIAEAQALKTILIQTALICTDQKASFNQSEKARRAEGGKVWSNDSSCWGFSWLRQPLDWNSQTIDPKTSAAQPNDALAHAVDEAMREALAQGPTEGALTAAKLAVALQSIRSGSLSIRALNAFAKDPGCLGLPIPLDANDWLAIPLLAKSAFDDERLGQWLASIGCSWSAPAKMDSSSLQGKRVLRATMPAWSHAAEPHSQSPPPHGLADWTPLEWMPLLGRPGAARHAVLLGTQLHPLYEQAIEAADAGRPWNFSSSKEEVLSIADACRIAQSTLGSTPSSVPRARRI